MFSALVLEGFEVNDFDGEGLVGELGDALEDGGGESFADGVVEGVGVVLDFFPDFVCAGSKFHEYFLQFIN